MLHIIFFNKYYVFLIYRKSTESCDSGPNNAHFLKINLILAQNTAKEAFMKSSAMCCKSVK